jgi:cbb3-type cytochrome oxidase subunit 1
VPRLSVWCIRAALLYLVLGFTLGALMLAAPSLHLPATLMRLRPVHTELLLIGWMVQLACGVAYWILPRNRGIVRGNEPLAWGAAFLLNAGLLAAGLGAAFGAPAAVVGTGRLAELVAALAFALHVWRRARLYSLLRSPSPGNG